MSTLKRRRTKIVATVGPASRSPEMIDRLIRAGVNVFRLNMSHGTHSEHQETFQHIRSITQGLNEPVAVLADLCGPKIRAGSFQDGRIELKTGETVTVTTRDVMGANGLIPSHYHGLAHDVQPNDKILLDDGLLELQVLSVEGTEVRCKVINGGILKDRKGMNLPGVTVSAPSLTEKDIVDAGFALGLGVDLLALSFVRTAAEVEQLKRIVQEAGQETHVIAKIEKPEALENIDEILESAHGIMVARGDLGVELSPEMVPIAQRQLVLQARVHNKPVIVATQMLESMISNPRPTRAEVSDVSSAVFSGTDAIMLSAETALGAHPLEAVEMMDRIARQVEGWQWQQGHFTFRQDEPGSETARPLSTALARATAQLSRDLLVRAIVVLSKSGQTATVMSSARPAAPIIAVTTAETTLRRMNLLWGVVPLTVEDHQFSNPHELARRCACDFGLAEEGEYLLMVSGFKTKENESSPVLTVLRV